MPKGPQGQKRPANIIHVGLIPIVAVLLLSASAAIGAGADSHPDFAPNPSVGWVSAGVRLLPPPSGPGPVTAARGQRTTSNNDVRASGAQAVFAMGDVDAPILQPWAREQMRQRNERILAGKPAFSRQASCWPVGTPGFLLYAVQPVYFVQSPKEVVMIWQADHQVRHVYLNVPHSSNPKPSWFGESVGHYEGDTLVVDTIASDTRTFIDQFETPHTEKLHTIERFHMTNGGMAMEVNLHVEDPGAFTTPWDAIQRYRRVEPGVAEVKEAFNALSSTSAAGPILESSCAENPNSLFGAEGALPIPQTDKPDF
ncbi:MAG TPA: hypothetical protein VEU95_05130 [Micropepsaceae bacterium]|nr:hypothetical protein [Micropepsaceae bacterium]